MAEDMRKIILFILASSVVGCASNQADRSGAISTRDGGVLHGEITWLPARQTYHVAGAQTTAVSLLDVAAVHVKEPTRLPRASALVKNKRYPEAIPILESIVKEYKMLEWDLEASRLLATCYLGLKQPGKALAVLKSPTKRTSGLQQESLQLLAIEALLDLREFKRAEQWAKHLSPAGQATFGDLLKQKGRTPQQPGA